MGGILCFVSDIYSYMEKCRIRIGIFWYVFGCLQYGAVRMMTISSQLTTFLISSSNFVKEFINPQEETHESKQKKALERNTDLAYSVRKQTYDNFLDLSTYHHLPSIYLLTWRIQVLSACHGYEYYHIYMD